MNDYISREDALNFEMNLEAESEQEMLGIVRGMQIYADHIKSLPGVGWIKVTSRQTYDELDELIANLRNCAKVNSLSMYKRGLMKKAADAIEELDMTTDNLNYLYKTEVPRWISVTERLPEKYIGEWLCYTDDGKIMILPYDTPGDGSKECVFYAWDDDGYSYQTFNVTHWMPLPEPPKEE